VGASPRRWSSSGRRAPPHRRGAGGMKEQQQPIQWRDVANSQHPARRTSLHSEPCDRASAPILARAPLRVAGAHGADRRPPPPRPDGGDTSDAGVPRPRPRPLRDARGVADLGVHARLRRARAEPRRPERTLEHRTLHAVGAARRSGGRREQPGPSAGRRAPKRAPRSKRRGASARRVWARCTRKRPWRVEANCSLLRGWWLVWSSRSRRCRSPRRSTLACG
jgi:hypothetical protein